MIRKELDLPIQESIFWTDSTAVIQLIENKTKRFHTFVANRLSIIQDGSSPAQWMHVDSKSNPADDASRGLTADQTIRNQRWLNGPSFLWKTEDHWPARITLLELSDDNPEVKPEVRTYITSQRSVLEPIVNRYSSWDRLKRGVAWLLRYKRFLMSKPQSCKGKDADIIKGDLSVEEVQGAEKEVIASVQKEAVHLEIAHSLNTDSFIDALRRFIARRGRTATMVPIYVVESVSFEKHSRNGINRK